MSLFSAELTVYDQKKLEATKAILHKPSGEIRTPHSEWSGWGFSKSMTESVIRERYEKSQQARESR